MTGLGYRLTVSDELPAVKESSSEIKLLAFVLKLLFGFEFSTR